MASSLGEYYCTFIERITLVSAARNDLRQRLLDNRPHHWVTESAIDGYVRGTDKGPEEISCGR
jgi:hypothetical protein